LLELIQIIYYSVRMIVEELILLGELGKKY